MVRFSRAIGILLGGVLAVMQASAQSPMSGVDLPPHVNSNIGPRIECDRAMLDRARKRIMEKVEPFYTYWEQARPDVERALTLEPMPYIGADSLAFHGAVQEQGIAARLLAYSWHLDGNEIAGAQAVKLLDAWASATPRPGSAFDPKIRHPNSGMDVARGMLPFVAAFDLLGGHPALTPDRRERIAAWFRTLVGVVKEGIRRWEKNDDFGGQEYQNHHAAHVLGLVLFGAALGDDDLIRFAIDHPDNPKDFKKLIAGLILMPGDTPLGGRRGKPVHAGEIQDRVRTDHRGGLTYCHLSLTLLLYTADTLTRVTGEDYLNWKAPGGECLRLPATFYADFYRLRDARIKGGYYANDHPSLQNIRPFLGTFEVALAHWPEDAGLQAIVRSMDRASTPRSWVSYYGLPLLTHGVDPSREDEDSNHD